MKNENSICFVEKINEIKDIEGADNIQLGVIGGWNCIIKKDQHTVGDLVIVATTDAVIPFKTSEKLGITNYLRKDGRVKTVKLRGVYSECLIITPELVGLKSNDLVVGDDYMDKLGIFKYEPPIKQIQLSSGRKIKYQSNPSFGVYYKFPNIKNVKGMFSESDEVQITRKIHGTNSRYGIVKKNRLSFIDKVKKFFGFTDEWVNFEYVYGSHNVEKGSDSQGFYDTDVWSKIAEKYKIKEKLWSFVKEYYTPNLLGDGMIIYGEIFGPGIQKNYDYNLKEIEFVGFDIKLGNEYQNIYYVKTIFRNLLELPHVEVLYEGCWSQEIQDKFIFDKIKDTKIPHEGIVIKAITGERQKIAKVINPDYLIYGEKNDVGDSH